MAEGNGKSEWVSPQFILAVVVAVAGAVSSWAITQERIRTNKEALDKLESRMDTVEKKIPGMDTIDASLKKIDGNLEKLTDRFNTFVESQVQGHR